MFIPPSSLGLHLRDQMGFGGYGDPRSLPRELSLCSTHTLLLQWGHSSNLNCNPGVTRSVGLLWQLFRSLTLKDGIQVFFLLLLALSVSRKRPHASGQNWLCPLPVLHIPYLIVPGLSLSEGNTIILTIADSFSVSKMEFCSSAFYQRDRGGHVSQLFFDCILFQTRTSVCFVPLEGVP